MFFKKNIICFLFLFFTACSSIPRPPLEYIPGAQVNTLSSAVSISIHSTERSMAGHGYLIYQRPDQVHLIMLSPFGTTLFEAFAIGEKVALVYPSQSVAYAGQIAELPDKGGLQSWRQIRWVMDIDAPGADRSNKTVKRQSKSGIDETVTFENGLVTAKSASNGDQVFYSDYVVINGVAVAEEVEIRNEREDRIRLKLDEPEINVPLENSAFTPKFEGMKVFPLSELQGR